MPALACCVDAAVAPPPGYAFAWDRSLPAPEALVSSEAPRPTNAAPAPTASLNLSHWSPSLSSALYRIDGWGDPYFTVNSSGDISVRPHGTATLSHQEIDLLKVVKKASDPKSSDGLDLQLPLVVWFPDVLKNQLESLQYAFHFAIESQGYE